MTNPARGAILARVPVLRTILPILAAVAAAVFLLARVADSTDMPIEPVASGDGHSRAATWAVTAADVRPDEAGGLRVEPPGDGSVTLRRDGLELAADACESPVLFASGPAVEAGFGFALQWRRAGDPATYEIAGRRPGARDLLVPTASTRDAIRLSFPDLPLHPAWTGRVTSLAWRLLVDAHPVVLHRAGAPAAPWTRRIRMYARQWLRRDPVSPSSFNSIRAPHVAGLTPNAWLVLLAISAFGAIAAARRIVDRRRPARPAAANPVRRATVAAAIVGSAWLANDARLAAGQYAQLRADRARFADAVTPRETAARLWPPALLEAAELMHAHAPRGATYAVFGGDVEAGDARLRYLLAPVYVQVNVDVLQPPVPLERAEYVLLLTPDAAAIDAAGRLRLDGWPRWRLRPIAESPAGVRLAARMPE